MERELLITVRTGNYDDTKINREIEYIKSLFPYLESFELFTASNQVFDVQRHTVISRLSKLKHIYNEGTQKHNSFIICLN